MYSTRNGYSPPCTWYSVGLSQCLRECLCPCLDLIRILTHTVAGHIIGVKAFWWTLKRVTAEDSLEQGDQRQLKDSGWEGAASQKAKIYHPIRSSLVSSSSLVAITICSSFFPKRWTFMLYCPNCTCCPLYGPQGHLEVVSRSVVIGEEGWIWPTFTTQRLQGWYTCFQLLRIQLTFPPAKATCFCLLSGLSPPIPPTWRAPLPACPNFALSFQEPLISLFGQLVLCAGALSVA